MARFHFDVRYNQEPWSNDPDGIDLNDAAEARSQAFALAEGIAREHVAGSHEIVVRVRDSESEPLLTLRASVTIQDRPPHSS